jgi:hypothetical protein
VRYVHVMWGESGGWAGSPGCAATGHIMKAATGVIGTAPSGSSTCSKAALAVCA